MMVTVNSPGIGYSDHRSRTRSRFLSRQVLCLGWALCGLLGPAFSQTESAPGLDPTQLRLIPGDQLALRVIDEPDITGSYTVRDDGNILLPIVNEVKLAGLTLAEATEAIRQALSVPIIAPQISLELSSQAARRVYMSGEVGSKGVLPWAPDMTLSKALNLAGGISPLGDMGNVKIKRGGEELLVDATGLLLKGAFETDVPVWPEDHILVPKRSRCFILGPVPGAGEAYFEPDETLYQLLSRLGVMSAKPELRSVRLVRREAELVVNLEVIRQTGDTETDVKLTPNDRIVIAERGEIYLAGAVASPGTIDIRGAETAAKAIFSRGGFRPDAALDRCILVHDGEATEMDLSPVLIDGRADKDVSLASGDLLIVPENKVLVFGAVAKPGPVALPWPSRLSDALAVSGGPLPQSDLRHITVIRNEQPNVVNASAFVEGGATPRDPQLKAYDIVLVPEAWVSIMGQVARPQRVPYREAQTLHQLLSSVGSLLEDADLTAVYLIRGNETRQMDITTLVREGDPAADIELEPGDRVVVPEGLGKRIYITGQVSTTSGGQAVSLRYEEAPDVARAIASVSGVLTGGGDLTQARILRKGEVIPVDLHALYYENDLTQNVPLEPGDTIWIPTNEQGFVYIFGAGGTQRIAHFPGLRLTQVMAQLNIPVDDASTDNIRLLRGTGDQREILTVPWGKLWSDTKDENLRDPELERGDIILIREKSSTRHWRNVQELADKYFLFRSVLPSSWLPF